MSVTMLPSGGTVFPSFRPSGDTSSGDTSPSASQLTNYQWNQDSYMDNLIDMANKGDVSAIEKLVNLWSTQESEKTAREWTAEREGSAYQRLNEDLRKAGISPYVLSGATPVVSSSSGKSYSGSEMTSRANSHASNGKDTAKAILQLVGVVLGALVYSML